MFTRRGFLFLLGAGAGSAGLLLATRGLVAVPDRFVLAHAGACSFCGKDAAQTRALAGIAGCRTRICDECVGLCFDILAEDRRVELPAVVNRRREPLAPAELAELERMFIEQPSEAKAFHCSFCGHSRQEVEKLIAGPAAFVCDECIEDAWTLLRSV